MQQNNRNVNDFISVTWNTQGGRWNEIRTEMNNDVSLDVLAIQEAGNLPASALQTNDPPNVYTVTEEEENAANLGTHVRPYNPAIIEYLWPLGQNIRRGSRSQAYIYYYAGLQSNPRTNIAMVSRHRASRIIVIESIINETRESRNRATYGLGSNTSESLWTRRPAIGIQIENSIFFNLHAASEGDYNEAQLLVTMIENYVLQFHPGTTTLIMGDFNRSPQSLENALVPLPDNTISRRIVSIPQSTQQSGGILDYAVWLSGVAITATAVLGASFLTRGGAVSTSSDHFPVRFCAS